MDSKLFLVEFDYDVVCGTYPRTHYGIIKANSDSEAISISQKLRTQYSRLDAENCISDTIKSIRKVVELDSNQPNGLIFCTDSSVIYDTTEEERLYEILLTLNEIINDLLAQSYEYITPEDNERLNILFPNSKDKFKSIERFELIAILSKKIINISNRYKELQVEVSDTCLL